MKKLLVLMFSIVLLGSCGKRTKGPASRMVNPTSAGLYVSGLEDRTSPDTTIILANRTGIYDVSKRECIIEVEKLGRNKIQLNAFLRDSSILSCELKLKQSSYRNFGSVLLWHIRNKETENISLEWRGRYSCDDGWIYLTFFNELGQELYMSAQGVLN